MIVSELALPIHSHITTSVSSKTTSPQIQLLCISTITNFHLEIQFSVRILSCLVKQIFNCCILVIKLCATICDPMDYRPPGSSVHGVLLARILEWVAIYYSRGSSQPRDQTHVSQVSCVGRWVLYHWVTEEACADIKTCSFPEQCVLIISCLYMMIFSVLSSLCVSLWDGCVLCHLSFLELSSALRIWQKLWATDLPFRKMYAYVYVWSVCL